jgi:hypothetical protein
MHSWAIEPKRALASGGAIRFAGILHVKFLYANPFQFSGARFMLRKTPRSFRETPLMMDNWTDRLAAAVYRMRLRSKLSGSPQRNQRISNPWHAVSVVTGSVVSGAYVCEAAAKLRGTRLLSTEAPNLPLPDCTAPSRCTCHFRHHPDRRSERRRARDNGFGDRSFSGVERRGPSRGRRATDG